MVYHLDSIIAAKRSNVSDAQSYVTEKLECFLAARREERLMQYKRLVALMWRILGIGDVLASAGKAGGYAAALPKSVSGTFAAGIVYFWGALMLSCGMVGSTCPLEDVNVDEVLDTDRPLWRGLVAILSGICLVHAMEAPHVHAAGAILCIAVLCTGQGIARRVRATTCLVLFAASLALGNSLRFLMCGLSERGGVPLVHWAALAGAEALAMVCCLAAWLRNRRHLQRRLGRADAAATLAFYPALYGHCGVLGLDLVWSGSLSVIFAADHFDLAHGLTNLAAGMALLQSVAVVCITGRRVVSRFVVARLLGRAHSVDKERDGAFLAAMLDSCGVMVGGVWWVHRDEFEKDLRYPPTDHRHHWQKGIIADIQDEKFIVKAGDASKSVPMANRDVPWEHLLIMARKDLRCIEWKDFTVDIFKWDSATGDGLTGNRSAAGLSRTVRPDESIDFFISHSWNDDADAKFQEVVQIVEEFKKLTGREPTFWLDHVCIDQNNIADGLKVLPVNVMSCHAFIALCGPSYFTRLWCVWELCTVMAFTPPDEVLNRVILAGLGLGSKVDTLSLCAKFDISTCCSYDPNEEVRVKRVVNAFGQAYFNRRTQRLGDLTSSRSSGLSTLQRSISKSSSSSLRWP